MINFVSLTIPRDGRPMSIYLGIGVSADDFVLLAPSRNGLQEMNISCEKNAIQCKLKFSTNVNPSKS